MDCLGSLDGSKRKARTQRRRTWQGHRFSPHEREFTYEVRCVICPNWEEIFASILGPIDEREDLLPLAVLREYLTLLSERKRGGAAEFLSSLQMGTPKLASLGLPQLIWDHNEVSLKVWYDRVDEPIRISSDVAGETDDEFIEAQLWPMNSFFDFVKDPVVTSIAQVEEAWPPLREFLGRDEKTETSLGSCGWRTWLRSPGRSLLLSSLLDRSTAAWRPPPRSSTEVSFSNGAA